ncbi:hypothetical protein BDN72DRAFT_773503 [Pluteus cervinus]|uniref:Uncharacterized protein n=1 Tax=Pluteus cervinus TaxID=181527 RepID=A0ACD3AIP8_9AGAR|nr:hypothetical protein BDN72DRAFT_773503 [Pluteus cervinus]
MGLEAFLQGDFNDTDLERFLAVLFPSVYGQYDASSVEEWASVLKVAHEWEFESIRKLALAQIEPIATAVDEVVFGKGYDVPAWTEKGRIRLCRREEPITPEEGVRLGLEEVLKISDIRQRIRPGNLFAVVDSSVIRALFSGDLHDVKNIVHKSEVAIKSRLTQLKEELDRFTRDQENKRILAQKETRRVIAEEEAKRTRVKSETKSLSLNAQVERDGIKAETERIQSAHRIAWVGIQHQQESQTRNGEDRRGGKTETTRCPTRIQTNPPEGK